MKIEVNQFSIFFQDFTSIWCQADDSTSHGDGTHSSKTFKRKHRAGSFSRCSLVQTKLPLRRAASSCIQTLLFGLGGAFIPPEEIRGMSHTEDRKEEILMSFFLLFLYIFLGPNLQVNVKESGLDWTTGRKKRALRLNCFKVSTSSCHIIMKKCLSFTQLDTLVDFAATLK